MSVNVGHLYKKRTVRKLDGSIYELSDEADGGAIISKGRVVNQERINELAKIEQDKQAAAGAAAHAVESPNANARNGLAKDAKIVEQPITSADAGEARPATETLEKRVDEMETKLDQILKAVQK